MINSPNKLVKRIRRECLEVNDDHVVICLIIKGLSDFGNNCGNLILKGHSTFFKADFFRYHSRSVC